MFPNRAALRATLERLLELKRAGALILESPEYFLALLGSWYGERPWVCRPWMTVNVDPSGRIVMPCYVLQEYNGKVPIWAVDVRALWNSFDWDRCGSCNKCALACYLEPSVFAWANPGMVRERVLEAPVEYLHSRRRARARGALPVVKSRPPGGVPHPPARAPLAR